MVINKCCVENENLSTDVNNQTLLYTKPLWCVPENVRGTRMILMSVYKPVLVPHGCSQVVWKEHFAKQLIFIPL